MSPPAPENVWDRAKAGLLERCEGAIATGLVERFRNEGTFSNGPGEEITVWVDRYPRNDRWYGIYVVKHIDQRPDAAGRHRWPVTHHAYWDENGTISWQRAPWHYASGVPPLVKLPVPIFRALHQACQDPIR